MKPRNLLPSTCVYLLLMSLLLACTNTKDYNTCNECEHSDNNVDNRYTSAYICTNASSYQGTVVGDGHCVSLIKRCSNAPNTDQWRPGQSVWKNNIQTGSIIATFKEGRYPSKSGYHAAIYIRQDANGIWVWDQWQGKPVHQRLIRWRNDNSTSSNTAQDYQTVLSVNQSTFGR